MEPIDMQKVVVIEDDDDVIMLDNHNKKGFELEPTGVFKNSGRLPTKKSIFKMSGTPSSLAAPIDHSSIPISGKVTHRLSTSGISSRINSTFRNPNWGTKSLDSTSIRVITDNLTRRQSTRSHSVALSSSPNSFQTGTVLEPIDLDDLEDSTAVCELRIFPLPNKRQLSGQNYYHRNSSQMWPRRVSFVMLDDDEDETDGRGTASSLTRSIQRARSRDDNITRSIGELIKEKEVVEVGDMEDVVYNGVNITAVEDVYLRDEETRTSRKPFRIIKPPARNPLLANSWERLGKYTYNKLEITPNKTLELREGTFARVRAIFQNTATSKIQLRGHRLQRVRDLNGLLDKKLNEVVVCFEIDLNDHRDPLEQAAIEISLDEVLRIRNTRFTNQKFPLCRNVDPLMYNNRDALATEGGLTARWKYTCTYATAGDRHHNKFKERALERLKEEECGRPFAVSSLGRRFQWRGETIPGGAYRLIDGDDESVMVPDDKVVQPISITSTPEPEEINIVNPKASKVIGTSGNDIDKNATNDLPTPKRKRSQIEDLDSVKVTDSEQKLKKIRSDQEKEVEETKEGISSIILDPEKQKNSRTLSVTVDLTLDTSSSLKLSQISQVINLLKSDLSTPPTIGSITSQGRATQTLITRSASQQLTYGDAFCGAGGSTRGATMAGFRVKWGFDLWDNACASWKANFPHAKCYHMDAHDFVQVAKLSQNRDLMKVDVLHLSPPCQFFSPAHTIDGANDEMNTASLFAVLPVIEVSKPRIATLEQTFGIDCPRFRFYFRSLIQMFTTLDFSVRWAIIPLAQWGLPQRRNRLIVIASCPGEILPQMPLPTHSESDTNGLRPFVSANHTLSQIPPNAPDHDPASVTFAPERRMPPWDGDKILPRAMTTSGGQNYHPSGKRDLTLREYAALQGFPMVHVFRGSYVKKQIGNAVPPVCAKVMFESVKRDLDRADGVVEEAIMID